MRPLQWRLSPNFPNRKKSLAPFFLVSWKLRRLRWSWRQHALSATAYSNIGVCHWWIRHFSDIWSTDSREERRARYAALDRAYHRKRTHVATNS